MADLMDDRNGVILDASTYSYKGNDLQTTEDKTTVLIPQPSSDPNDPLNWPQRKKYGILVIISIITFLSDFGTTGGIPALIPQAM